MKSIASRKEPQFRATLESLWTGWLRGYRRSSWLTGKVAGLRIDGGVHAE
jgi:hypothetical protein